MSWRKKGWPTTEDTILKVLMLVVLIVVAVCLAANDIISAFN